MKKISELSKGDYVYFVNLQDKSTNCIQVSQVERVENYPAAYRVVLMPLSTESHEQIILEDYLNSNIENDYFFRRYDTIFSYSQELCVLAKECYDEGRQDVKDKLMKWIDG